MIQNQADHVIARYLLHGTYDAANFVIRMFGLHVRLERTSSDCGLFLLFTSYKLLWSLSRFNELSDTDRAFDRFLEKAPDYSSKRLFPMRELSLKISDACYLMVGHDMFWTAYDHPKLHRYRISPPENV